MTTPGNPIIYDRAVEIKSKEELGKFLADPKAYLSDIGALDGLPEFNGFIDEQGNQVDIQDKLRVPMSSEGEISVLLIHYGIPFASEWYCGWRNYEF